MAGAITYPVRAPAWTLSYQGVGIAARIESMVLSVTYTTHMSGAAPELELEIEDRNKRWQGPWFPQRGDLVEAAIGYAGEAIVSCGSFQVDEVELRGAPDVIHLRCLAAYITDAMRTPNSTAYENQTLLGIARAVAAKYGFSVLGAAVNPDVSFARVTQEQESDLEFLHRLAREHDYEFTVRGSQMIFYSRPALEQHPSVALLRRSDVTRFSFKAKTRRLYRAAQVSYQDPSTKKLIAQTATADPPPPVGDTLKLVRRCENGQQATLKAQAALARHNLLQVTGELTMPGSTRVTAGAKITLGGFGRFDGDYMVKQARHRLHGSAGYTTEVEIYNVA
jgi:phage protein D